MMGRISGMKVKEGEEKEEEKYSKLIWQTL